MSAQGDLLISGGTVIDPASKRHGPANVLIRGGEIAAVDVAGELASAQVVDVTGCYVFPGLIDYHTHLFYGGTAIGVSPRPGPVAARGYNGGGSGKCWCY